MMRPSSQAVASALLLLLSVLSAATLEGLSAAMAPAPIPFSNPCLKSKRPYVTTLGSVQGMWNGSCSRIAEVRGVDRSGPFDCVSKPDTYPFFIVFNGTGVGFIVNGITVPIGMSRIVNTQIIEVDSMLMLLNISNVRTGGYDQGVAHANVACKGGRPIYTEFDIHSLANGGDPATFPVPLKQDSKLWCNDRNTTVKEHPPGYYNIICTATRVGDVGPTWP